MAKNLRDLLEEKAARLGEQTFLIFEGKEVSYSQLNREANRRANLLKALGVTKGDKVCIMLSNCPEFLYLWFGLAIIGAVMVPLNIHLKGEILEYIINHSDAEILFMESRFIDQVHPIVEKIPKIRWKVAGSSACSLCPQGFG